MEEAIVCLFVIFGVVHSVLLQASIYLLKLYWRGSQVVTVIFFTYAHCGYLRFIGIVQQRGNAVVHLIFEIKLSCCPK